jgi:hypothetical protein
MELIKGHIYQCDGEIYRAGKRDDVLFLFRVDEEKGETLPALSVGERLGFMQLPDGVWRQLVQGSPDSDGSMIDTPGGTVNFEHLADSSEEYVRKRAMGYYRLLHLHVYCYRDQLLCAYKPSESPETLVLYLLNPDTYALVERRPGAFYAYIKMGEDIWQRWHVNGPVSFPSELTIDDLDHVGAIDALIDDMVDRRFTEIMGDDW